MFLPARKKNPNRKKAKKSKEGAGGVEREVLDSRDIYEEILGTGAAQGPQTPKRRRARRKKNVGAEAPTQEE